MAFLTWLHLIGLMIWVGSIISVGIVIIGPGEPKHRGTVARRLYLRLAVPGFALALLAGMLRLLHPAQGLYHYFVVTHFMHVKLVFALALIVIHHIIGARAKRLAEAKPGASRHVGWLTLGALASAIAAAYFPMFPF